MVNQEIMKVVRNYLRQLRGEGFSLPWGVIFGSRATAQAHKWSDIDLLVISSRFDDVIEHQDIDRLWWIAAEVDCRIEPIPCGEKQWLEDDCSAIIDIARRDGYLVKI